MRISTIIVIYNGLKNDWIQKCFSSVQNSTIKTEIIAIDNKSSDESVAYIKDRFPEVKLIELDENKGFGKANNIGLQYALAQSSDHFFLLNQDATVENDTIERLSKQLTLNKNYGIISPMHFNGKGDALDVLFSLEASPFHCKDLFSDYVTDNVQEKVYESDFVCAAAWMISKECLRKIGGFSPTFFHYGEDDNYAHRMQFKKMKIGIYPHTKIFHDRENRTENPFDSSFEDRKYIVWASNPNRNVNLLKELRILERKKIMYKLLRDKHALNYLYDKINLIKNWRTTIEKNRTITQSDEEFIFLEMNEKY